MIVARRVLALRVTTLSIFAPTTSSLATAQSPRASPMTAGPAAEAGAARTAAAATAARSVRDMAYLRGAGISEVESRESPGGFGTERDGKRRPSARSTGAPFKHGARGDQACTYSSVGRHSRLPADVPPAAGRTWVHTDTVPGIAMAGHGGHRIAVS